jgi:protein-tyrosine phosphatase
MIDTHCHVLPGIDDGPKSWESSLAMCEAAADDGITHIVATPHCNHVYRYDRQACEQTIQDLGARFPKLEFIQGCEFRLTEKNLLDVAERPHEYAFGNTRYILVELNEFDLPAHVTHSLSALISIGLIPIIAHPERYPIIQRNIDVLEEWVGFGCLSAITAPSLVGPNSSSRHKLSEALLKRNLAHMISSDAHDTKRRPPILSEARKAAAKIVGRTRAEALVVENPRAIITGSSLS